MVKSSHLLSTRALFFAIFGILSVSNGIFASSEYTNYTIVVYKYSDVNCTIDAYKTEIWDGKCFSAAPVILNANTLTPIWIEIVVSGCHKGAKYTTFVYRDNHARKNHRN